MILPPFSRRRCADGAALGHQRNTAQRCAAAGTAAVHPPMAEAQKKVGG